MSAVPEAFPAGVYEQLIEDLQRSKLFASVYRDGQASMDTSVLTLRIKIVGFKKGNERTRSIAPFWGSTELKTDVQLENADGTVLLREPVTSSVHFYHEDLKVIHGLCKKIEKELKRSARKDNSARS